MKCLKLALSVVINKLNAKNIMSRVDFIIFI